jgi:hypothetical protein
VLLLVQALEQLAVTEWVALLAQEEQVSTDFLEWVLAWVLE